MTPAFPRSFSSVAVVSAMIALPAFGQYSTDFSTDAGWTVTGPGGASEWQYAPIGGLTGEWSVADNDDIAETYLESPVFQVTDSNVFFTVDHSYDMEENIFDPSIIFDGGLVEFSLNGGAFQQLSPANFDGYNGVVDDGFMNPFANRDAFSGPSGGLITNTGELTASPGDTLVIRFGFGSDTSVDAVGWAIDGFAGDGFVIPAPASAGLLGLAGLAALRRRRA